MPHFQKELKSLRNPKKLKGAKNRGAKSVKEEEEEPTLPDIASPFLDALCCVSVFPDTISGALQSKLFGPDFPYSSFCGSLLSCPIDPINFTFPVVEDVLNGKDSVEVAVVAEAMLQPPAQPPVQPPAAVVSAAEFTLASASTPDKTDRRKGGRNGGKKGKGGGGGGEGGGGGGGAGAAGVGGGTCGSSQPPSVVLTGRTGSTGKDCTRTIGFSAGVGASEAAAFLAHHRLRDSAGTISSPLPISSSSSSSSAAAAAAMFLNPSTSISPSAAAALIRVFNCDRVLGIGPIGLDYSTVRSSGGGGHDVDDQKLIFRLQLEIARYMHERYTASIEEIEAVKKADAEMKTASIANAITVAAAKLSDEEEDCDADSLAAAIALSLNTSDGDGLLVSPMASTENEQKPKGTKHDGPIRRVVIVSVTAPLEMQQRGMVQLSAAESTRIITISERRDVDNDMLNILGDVFKSKSDCSVPIMFRTSACGMRWETIQQLMIKFPNSFFSIDCRLTHSKQKLLKEYAFDIPLSRIVLESNGPLYPPSGHNYTVAGSHPGHVLVTAQSLADIKRLDVKDVLEQVYTNTKKLYSC